jgi:hypothetical protein
MATQTTTVSGQQSIPTELMPYFTGAGKAGETGFVPGLLPKAQELYARNYDTAVGNQLAASGLGGAGRIAGLSGLEQQVGQQIGQMQTPGQFGTGTGLSTQAGQGQLGTVGQAAGYGQMGAGYGTAGVGMGQQAAGLAGLGLGLGGQAAGAGQNYMQMATSPGSQQAFMSPYMQNVVDFQKDQAIRDYGLASQGRNAQAVKSGAFGGSRQAVYEGEANRALMNQLAGIQATGTQQAFADAQKQMQFGSQLGLQGLQTGLQGLGAANQAYQTGLQGTAQGMQGAQIGLQGVGAQQAGFTGANQAAATLGQLGTQQQAADMQRLQAMSAQGATERGIQQQGLDTRYSDLMNRINYPTEQLGGMANILRGVPTTQGSQTSTTTAPPPSFASQLAGVGLSGLSLYNMFK